jgi:hypothetical protein
MGKLKGLTLQNTTALTDGWDDAAAEDEDRPIRGTLLKFRDFRWYAGQQGVTVEDGTRLIAVATLALWQRWEDGRVVERIVRRPGQALPARGTLSFPERADTDRDPWQNTRLVYLLHPVSAAEYTFSTASGGGRSAVSVLAGAIKRMRRGQPGAVPVVELRSEPMRPDTGPSRSPASRSLSGRSTILAPPCRPMSILA